MPVMKAWQCCPASGDTRLCVLCLVHFALEHPAPEAVYHKMALGAGFCGSGTAAG